MFSQVAYMHNMYHTECFGAVNIFYYLFFSVYSIILKSQHQQLYFRNRYIIIADIFNPCSSKIFYVEVSIIYTFYMQLEHRYVYVGSEMRWNRNSLLN